MSHLDNSAPGQGAEDPIVPIDFKPHEADAGKLTFKFHWFYAVVAVVVLVSVAAGWFVLTAKSVFVDVDPVTAEVDIDGGLNVRLGQRFLIRAGTYTLNLKNAGYHDNVTELTVNEESAQTHSYSLRKLPGRVSISTYDLPGARVRIDDVDVGETPLTDLLVEPGQHHLAISKDRYQDYATTLSVEGRSLPQSHEARLEPAWAVFSFASNPSGAAIIVDGETVGTTPLSAEILQGKREVTLKLAGHKAWQQRFEVLAGEDIVLPPVELEPADGLVFIQSQPAGASVTVGGQFQGLTPLEVALQPDRNHELTFFLNGFQSAKKMLRIASGEESAMQVELIPITATVRIATEPADAELYINGEFRGLANQTLELMAVSQQIEVRKEGYVPHTQDFISRPGLEQTIRVTLKSLEQLRLEQIRTEITTVASQSLKLLYPGAFTMGASRREAGRRPNEALRDIKLERPFYLAYREVTNAQYRAFDAEHSSGTVQGLTLNNELQPVVRVSWNQAALYCNWLSEQEGLPLFYRVEEESVVGFNPESIGYRLPSEAEWAWAARSDDSGNVLKYPWGDQLPPPENAGNFGDITAQAYLGEVMFDYNDGHFATAPVGSYTANHQGLYDLAGNVSEWVHDYYGSVGSLGVEIDPLGSELGQFHTIRGSSWAHGAITEMRLSFRDFGAEARDDLGFRVARYLE
ncbi:MAG: PEGA domain-containing protein [Gammaproteobacteria bacterium]|nr:PEGA domain-containing protein [Gammaproteobacteria bacterium]MCY4358969.1 PEGA domain-containing protein [Gammaproteobacteria bacterium]